MFWWAPREEMSHSLGVQTDGSGQSAVTPARCTTVAERDAYSRQHLPSFWAREWSVPAVKLLLDHLPADNKFVSFR
jgi:hypothetical protein